MTAPARMRDRAQRDRIWRWAASEDVDLAGRYGHGNARVDDSAVMWGLLCHAVQVSRLADTAPPRTGYPVASPVAGMTVDDISWWSRVAAALRGETDGVVEDRPRPPRPDAFEIMLRDEVLEVWHRHALRDLGNWRRLRRAVFAVACGAPPRRVQAETGLTRDGLRHARKRALRDMLDVW